MKDRKSLKTSIIPMLLVMVSAGLIAASSGRKATTADTTKNPLGYPYQTPSGTHGPEVASLKVPNGHLPTPGGKGLGRLTELPLSFEPNQGQAPEEVRFLSQGHGYTLFLASTEAVVRMPISDSRLPINETDRHPTIDYRQLAGLVTHLDVRQFARGSDEFNRPRAFGNRQSKTVRMKLVGANPKAQIQGTEKLPGITNYFIGNDPKLWHTHIPTYAQVQYKDVFPGIDLTYYGNQRQLEYDFVVSAGADPGLIKMAYEGTRDIRIDEAGDLLISTAGLEIRQHRPRIYQEINGARREVAGNYVLKGKNVVGFHLEEYDVGQSVVIDPVLNYPIPSDFISVSRMALDASGNVYLCGNAGLLLPTTHGSYQESNPASGFGQAFVAKINATGSALVYATYLGGTDGGSGASGVATDPLGNAYVTGGTGASDFPLANPLQAARKGTNPDSTDFFVTKLNADGSNLIYSTYLGGSKNEMRANISVGASGDAYVSGTTYSNDFPTVNPFQSTLNGQTDIVLSRLNPTGNALIYSTYLGGTGSSNGEWAADSALDNQGNLYVTGGTNSNDFPIVNALQPVLRGSLNAFIAKLNPTGSELAFSTYLGGSESDQGTGIAVDVQGNAYITGITTSTDFPTAAPIQPTLSEGLSPGSSDIFVTKISTSGKNLIYSTYLGGNGSDTSTGIAVDTSGSAYIVGSAYSGPLVNPFAERGNGNSYLLKLNPQGNALVFSSTFGDSVDSIPEAIAVGASDQIYVARALGRVDINNTPMGGITYTFVPIDGVISRIANQPDIVLFVPIILSASGRNASYFTSELTLTNRGTKDASLEFNYTAAFGAGSGTATTTLLAGHQIIEPDAIEYLRELGIPISASGNRGGTLKVRFSGPSKASEVAVSVRTTTPAGNGRAGLAYPGVPGSMTLTGNSYLFGLRQDSADRSNVALQNAGNPGDGDVVVRLTIFSGDPGAGLSKILPDVRLSPGAFQQIDGILASNGISLTHGYVRIEPVGGTAPYYAYAVINDQTSSDGSFIPPFAENSLVRRDGWVVPAVVETESYTSEVILTNPTSKTRNLELVYNPGSGQVARIAIDLAPGEQKIIPAFVQYLRDHGVTGIGGVGPVYAGPLTVLDPEGSAQGVFAGARTLTFSPSGTFGVFYASAPVFETTTEVWLYGLRQNTETRSNLAIVNTGEANVYAIDLYDGDTGRKVNTIDGLTLAAGQWMQIGSILTNFAPGVRNGYAHVRRTSYPTSNPNRFIAYAVINDGGSPGERTGDGAFIASSP